MSFGKKILENLVNQSENWYFDDTDKNFYSYSSLGKLTIAIKNNIEFIIHPDKDKPLCFNIDYDLNIINKIISLFEKTILNYVVDDETVREMKKYLKDTINNNSSFEFSSSKYQDQKNGPFVINAKNIDEGSFKLDVKMNKEGNNENDLIKISYYFIGKSGQGEFIDFHYLLKEFENSEFINKRYDIVKNINNEKDLFNMVNKLSEKNCINISNFYLDLELENKNDKSITIKNKI